MAMFLASFGYKNKSIFGYYIAALQTIQDALDWETATATLCLEYDDHLLSSGGSGKATRIDEHTRALSADVFHQHGTSRQSLWKAKRTRRSDKRRCYACGKIDHVARDCM